MNPETKRHIASSNELGPNIQRLFLTSRDPNVLVALASNPNLTVSAQSDIFSKIAKSEDTRFKKDILVALAANPKLQIQETMVGWIEQTLQECKAGEGIDWGADYSGYYVYASKVTDSKYIVENVLKALILNPGLHADVRKEVEELADRSGPYEDFNPTRTKKLASVPTGIQG